MRTSWLKTNHVNQVKLLLIDTLVFICSGLILLVGVEGKSWSFSFGRIIVGYLFPLLFRLVGGVYRQVWRYSGIHSFLRLLTVDAIAFSGFAIICELLPEQFQIPFPVALSIGMLSSIVSQGLRMTYRYVYKRGNAHRGVCYLLFRIFSFFAGDKISQTKDIHRIRVAIVGAGRVGVGLANELMENPNGIYQPCCFVDTNKRKTGRNILDIPVISDNDELFENLRRLEIQEIVFAVPQTDASNMKLLYDRYVRTGCRLKVYDYPVMQSANGKRQLREIDIEELLFRRHITMENDTTRKFYQGKRILITGGGGSIGSEICRQVAKMNPSQVILLDICENGMYEIQQEMRMVYQNGLNIQVEVASITNYAALEKVFKRYCPQIVIHAAAHKHVPLMENNCIEAIENNVFGCENVIGLCEMYRAERFLLISTDKAVNPTNVMGATKRMCEMLALSAARTGKVKYSCTRFGNVLGSAGSVVPLFKRQLAQGGPITLTDKRIVRYFMTIPEASQLVLTSGALAENGEIMVLDMGKPVKILDLAKNMILLSGQTDVQIVEIGLRPGEKLYEELLMQPAKMVKTKNSRIFVEEEEPVDAAGIQEKMRILKEACLSGDNEVARKALRRVIPTYLDSNQEKNAVS